MIISTFDEMDDAIEGLLELFEEEDSESLVDLIKASFGGDRSAAGRYAANMRWRGQGKVAGFVGRSKYKLGADGSIHPRALMM